MSKLTGGYDFENAPCGYISFTPDGTVTDLNQTLVRWIGHEKEEVKGRKRIDQITAKGTGLYFQMFVYPLLKMQGYVNELSVNVVTSKGETISCLLNASASKDGDGNLHQIDAILFAITDRKKYENELLKAKFTAEAVAEHKDGILRAQRNIMSILGHDTRAPLFSINRIIKFAAEGKIGADEVYPYFELMANQLDATLILIENLLTWSKTNFNSQKETMLPFALADVAHEIVDLLHGSAVEKKLVLRCEIDPALSLTSNKSVVTFIIRNLVNNAIKFTGNGGVTISARRLGEHVDVTVSDTGIGMTAEQLDRFNKGEASSSAGTQNEKGSGLGLLLINEFLLQLNGQIRAESVPGSGTRVHVTFPEQMNN